MKEAIQELENGLQRLVDRYATDPRFNAIREMSMAREICDSKDRPITRPEQYEPFRISDQGINKAGIHKNFIWYENPAGSTSCMTLAYLPPEVPESARDAALEPLQEHRDPALDVSRPFYIAKGKFARTATNDLHIALERIAYNMEEVAALHETSVICD